MLLFDLWRRGFSKYMEREPDGTLVAKEEAEVYYENYYIRADKVRYNPRPKRLLQREMCMLGLPMESLK